MKRFLLPILLFLTTASMFAQEEQEKVSRRTRIAKQSATTSGDRGLFTVPSVETLNRNQFSFGYAWSNIDRTPQDLDINTLPVYLSYGLHGRLTVTGTFETQRQVATRNPTQPGFNPSFPFTDATFVKGYGDTILSAKYRLQRKADNVGGIALKGTVKFGTADAAKGLGTGQTDAGLDVIFTSLLFWGFKLESTMGYTATRDAKEPFPLILKDEMRSGVGTVWPSSGLRVGGGSLQGVFEYTTLTYVGCCAAANLATGASQNASDLAGGVRFLMLDQGLTFDAGYRTNNSFDRDFPGNRNRHGWTFNLTFTKPVKIQNLNNRYPVIALESASGEIPVGGSTAITASGFDADNDPLTYTWSTTGGQISGSGDKVTFNATGLAPGTYTIRATAMDGKGGMTISQIDITVRQ